MQDGFKWKIPGKIKNPRQVTLKSKEHSRRASASRHSLQEEDKP
jgi:hypothetical protein